MKLVIWVAICFGGLSCATGGAAGLDGRVNRKVSEELIAELGDTTMMETVVCSPDRKHVAYVRTTNGTEEVVVGTKIVGTYDRVKFLRFAPEGQKIVFLAKRGDKYCVISTDWKSKAYDAIADCAPAVSKDGTQIAFVAYRGTQPLVVMDGEESSLYDRVTKLSMDPSGKQVVYGVEQGKDKFVVVGGREVKQFGELGACVFSHDGKHCAYSATMGAEPKRWVLVLDNKVCSEAFDSIRSMVFSSSGDLAYVGIRDKKTIVFKGESLVGSYDGIGWGLNFSPDGKHLAFFARVGTKWHAVIDGRLEMEYDSIATWAPVYSTDNAQYGYTAKRDDKWRLVINGQEVGRTYDAVGEIIFSHDGKHFACEVKDDGKWYVVLDNRVLGPHQGLIGHSLAFGPNNMLVYIVKNEAGMNYVVNGNDGQIYDAIVLKDSNRIALEGLSEYFRSLDAIVNRDSFGIVFDGDARFHYCAIRMGEGVHRVYLVKEEVTINDK
jgi:hypothetical protein